MEELDRTTTCPFLLRCYWRENRHNAAVDYRQASRDIFPSNEIIIYTWMDATLKELVTILSEAVPQMRNKLAEVSIDMVYPDSQGIFTLKQIGQISVGKPGPDDEKTLASTNFTVGDYLDICVTIPVRNDSNRDAFYRNREDGRGYGRGGGRFNSNRGRSRY